MKFYFCESCNKRITEADLAAGAGRDKQMKGIFCQDCAEGVNTVAFDAITEADVAQTLEARPPSAVYKRGPAKSPLRNRAPSATARSGRLRVHADDLHADPPAPKKPTLALKVGLGALAGAALIGVGVFVFSGGSPAPQKSEPEPKPTVETKKAPAPAPAAVAAVAPAPPPVEHPSNAETAPESRAAAQSADAKASEEFDRVNKQINALPPADSAGRIKLAEAFVSAYPDSIESARMRVKMNDWRAPAPAPPPEPAPAATAATEPINVNANAGSTAGKESKTLFVCSPATDRGLQCYGDGEREERDDVFGAKGVVFKASAIPDPPWHSTIMHVSPKDTGDVHVGENSWIRFACRLEGTDHIMLHAFIGSGMYEYHGSGLPQNRWFWAIVKMSDFARNIRGDDPKPHKGDTFTNAVIYSGADKKPSTLLVGEFMFGDGPVPSE